MGNQPLGQRLLDIEETVHEASEGGRYQESARMREAYINARIERERTNIRQKEERRRSKESIFIKQEYMPETYTQTSPTTRSAESLTGFKPIKLEPQPTEKAQFVTWDEQETYSQAPQTTRSSKPNAGFKPHKLERQLSDEELFVTQDDEQETYTQGPRTTRFTGHQASFGSLKPEYDDFEEALILAKDNKARKSTRTRHASPFSEPHTELGFHNLERDSPVGAMPISKNEEPQTSKRIPETKILSGPYAGLKSAKKRVREDVDSETAPRKNIKPANSRVTNVVPTQTYSPRHLADVKYIQKLVGYAERDAGNGEDISEHIRHIQFRIQKTEFLTYLTPILVTKSGLCDVEGLPRIFENRVRGVKFPHDIRGDAEILYRKWSSGQVNPDLYRGTVKKTGETEGGTTFQSRCMDPDYQGIVSCAHIGAGNLLNGQWWPLQLCAKRDGAHGEQEAGIHGRIGDGAYSVVLGGGAYANIDNGNTVQYCGTQGEQGSPSAGTKLMMKALQTQHPLRLLRSHTLPATNTYRPACGIRYDGLYQVTGYHILNQNTAMHRFSLVRVGGQDPIRYQGEGRIPSDAQINQADKT